MRRKSRETKWEKLPAKGGYSYSTQGGHRLAINLPITPQSFLQEETPAWLVYEHKDGHELSVDGNKLHFIILPERRMNKRILLSSFYESMSEAGREGAFRKTKGHQLVKASLPILLQYLHDHLRRRG